MKKLLSIFAVFSLALTLSACGGTEENTEDTTVDTETEVESTESSTENEEETADADVLVTEEDEEITDDKMFDAALEELELIYEE